MILKVPSIRNLTSEGQRMAPKSNPLRLNNLQLKTLAILQVLGASPETSTPGDNSEKIITSLPYPHGDHFHIADKVVSAQNATGLFNPSVWKALERKGLVRSDSEKNKILTQAGCSYETRITDEIIVSS